MASVASLPPTRCSATSAIGRVRSGIVRLERLAAMSAREAGSGRVRTSPRTDGRGGCARAARLAESRRSRSQGTTRDRPRTARAHRRVAARLGPHTGRGRGARARRDRGGDAHASSRPIRGEARRRPRHDLVPDTRWLVRLLGGHLPGRSLASDRRRPPPISSRVVRATGSASAHDRLRRPEDRARGPLDPRGIGEDSTAADSRTRPLVSRACTARSRRGPARIRPASSRSSRAPTSTR